MKVTALLLFSLLQGPTTFGLTTLFPTTRIPRRQLYYDFVQTTTLRDPRNSLHNPLALVRAGNYPAWDQHVRSGPRCRCCSTRLFATKSKTSKSVDPEQPKKRTTKRKSTATAPEPPYWRNFTDPVELMMQCDQHPTHIRFKVRGNPLPLRRHRTSRGFLYNPSATAQGYFRDIVQDMIDPPPPQHHEDSGKNNSNPTVVPLFGNTTALAMTIVFRTKRPQSHFVASNRSRPLKRSAPTPLAAPPSRTDVDNLAKFVLDSLNGLLYGDDHQISLLSVMKLLDDDADCLGSTEVY
eukprot:CAMPEP_0168753828 /NCGR_PEP_ID=MMETSP0724-20121128/19163_1 /TAXON_ID=265536 /ORGANISM="Amphiprora sp., Strain CCMP467" /LENGTH=293 /DNA_ID=CAMNT_0008802241 /DNA_START=69 /DNA_END=947 /DNA_ORIENTATION=+